MCGLFGPLFSLFPEKFPLPNASGGSSARHPFIKLASFSLMRFRVEGLGSRV